METYAPKYLKVEPITGQAAEDAQVLNLIRDNRSRIADAELCAMVRQNHDRAAKGTCSSSANQEKHGAEESPDSTRQENSNQLVAWFLVILAVYILVAITGFVCDIAAGKIAVGIIESCIMGVVAAVVIFKLKEETTNAGK